MEATTYNRESNMTGMNSYDEKSRRRLRRQNHEDKDVRFPKLSKEQRAYRKATIDDFEE